MRVLYKFLFFVSIIISTTAYANYGPPIIIAIEKGDIDTVKKLLDKGVDVDTRRDGLTSLMFASVYGHLNIVNLLLANGADINAFTDESVIETALQWAAEKNHVNIVKVLIANGANVNATARDGRTALHRVSLRSARFDAKYVIEALLISGANGNIKDSFGNTALDLARDSGSELAVTLLKDFMSNETKHQSVHLSKFNVGDTAYICEGTVFGEKSMCKAEVLDSKGDQIKVMYLNKCTTISNKNDVSWIELKYAGTLSEVRAGKRCH